MRPVLSRKHHWALLSLSLIVAANTALTFVDAQVSDDQATMLAEALKQEDLSRYPHDEVLGPSGPGAPWRLRLPAWRWLLTSAIRLAGRTDPVNALRLLGTVTLAAYLLSMYVLLYRQTHSTSVATFVTIISTAIFSVKRPYWGIGPIFAVTPATTYLAFTPLLVYGLLRWQGRWRIVLVFFLVGAAANIDFVLGVNLAVVLLVALLALGRFGPRTWIIVVLSAMAATAGAAPAIWHYWRTLRAAEGFLPALTTADLAGYLQLAGLNLLYPGLLVEALRWLPIACGLAVPTAIILSRADRYHVENLSGWIAVLASALLVAFGLHGLMQLVGWWLGTAPPTLELFNSLRLAMLPLYALFAQAMIQILRVVARKNRVWVRAALAMFAVVYLGSSFNTLPLRHMVTDGIAALAGEGRQTQRRPDRKEMRSLARWASRETNTPPDAMFVAPSFAGEIRMTAQRAVMCSPADLRQLYYLAPSRLAPWAGLLRDQRRLLSPPDRPKADAGQIVRFVEQYWDSRSGRTAPTYLIIEARFAPEASGRLEEIVPPGGVWGRYWRLFRVPPRDPPASSRAARLETSYDRPRRSHPNERPVRNERSKA